MGQVRETSWETPDTKELGECGSSSAAASQVETQVVQLPLKLDRFRKWVGEPDLTASQVASTAWK